MGVLLALGIHRFRLILVFFVQVACLIVPMILFYILADRLNLLSELSGLVNSYRFEGKEIVSYEGMSSFWWYYVAGLLVVIPGIIALLRSYLYSDRPAHLMNFRG